MFESLQIGEEYGQTCITEMIKNHPEWDFYDFFGRFAPDFDNNNSKLYAETVAGWMKVSPNTVLKTLLFG